MFDLFSLHSVDHDIIAGDTTGDVTSTPIEHPLLLSPGGEEIHHAHLFQPGHGGAAEDHHGMPHASSATLDEHEVGMVSHETLYGAGGFHMIGDPLQEYSHWHLQNGQNSCAVVAQMEVYESITGNHVSEEQLSHLAQAHGWYDPESGTPPNCIGKVLNELGVETEHVDNASLTDLAKALDGHEKVIVAVNANELWHPQHDAHDVPLHQTGQGHAVWVTGIDVAPDGSATVYLNDSGTPNGDMEAVDARDFLNAWHDYHNMMVVAHA